MTEKFSNDASSALNGAITNVATTLVVNSAATFPSSGNFRIRIDAELMLVTAVSGTTFTVTRAIEGTTANPHGDQSIVDHIITVGSLVQAINDNAPVMPQELSFNAGVASTNSATYVRIGARKIDMTSYPATIGPLTRTVKFVADLDMTAGATSAEVKLFDLTDNVNVTSADLTSTSLSNDEQASSALTVGSSAGNIRSDAAKQYEVYLKMNGGLATDSAFCTNARLVITYA